MIKEEYIWEEVTDYFKDNTTIVFAGISNDERSNYFRSNFISWDCILIELLLTPDSKRITISRSRKNEIISTESVEFVIGLRKLIDELYECFQTVILDITSLQQSILMYLSKLLFKDYKPVKLFATYAEPSEYLRNSSGDFLSSEEFLGLKAIPGFTIRNRGRKIKLVSMLGFDGDRLMKVIEEIQDIETVNPIIGFPSFKPGWQSQSLKSSIRVIEYTMADVLKCNANSVFEAYELIEELKPKFGETYALAPLGTKPHSLACAIYATKNEGTLILYDHPKEISLNNKGVSRKMCYNLTSFL